MSSNNNQYNNQDDNNDRKQINQPKRGFPSPLSRQSASAAREEQPRFTSAMVYNPVSEERHFARSVPSLKGRLRTYNDNPRSAKSLNDVPDMKPVFKTTWQVQKETLALLTEDFPLENTSRRIEGVDAPEIATRISNCLSERSVHASFNHQKAKVKCTTLTDVRFRIQLFQTYEGQVVVEVQRRRGDGFRFMNECRAILDAAEGKSYVTTESPRVGPISNLKCLEHVIKKHRRDYTADFEHAESMLNKTQDDTLVLALEYLRDMSDPVKSSAGLVAEVSQRFLMPTSGVCARVLSLLQETAVDQSNLADNNIASSYKHQLLLNIISNVLTELHRNGELKSICETKELEDIILPALIDQLKLCNSLHCTVYAIKCVTVLSSSPKVQQLLLDEDIERLLQIAKEIGSQSHAALEREAGNGLLQCC